MAAQVYYSVSPFGTGNLLSGGSPVIEIEDGDATLALEGATQVNNIGQGVAVVFGGHTAYIASITDATHFYLVDEHGVEFPTHASTAVTSINHVWASLSAAEAAFTGASYINNTSLVTADVVANLCCYYDHDDYTADTTAVTIDGTTTDATRYINIYTPTGGTQSINNQRHNGIWSSSKYLLSTSANGSTLTIDDLCTVVTGLQICNTSYDADWRASIRLGDGSSNSLISRCIAKEAASITTTYRCGYYSASSTATVNVFRNCLAYGFLGTGSAGFATLYDSTAAGTGTRFLNCTAYNCAVGYYSFSGNYQRNVVKNCVAVGCTDCFREDGGSEWGGGSTNNAYDQGVDPGVNGVDISGEADAAIFVDAAAGNFNLISTSHLVEAGADLSAFMESYDIVGTARS